MFLSVLGILLCLLLKVSNEKYYLSNKILTIQDNYSDRDFFSILAQAESLSDSILAMSSNNSTYNLKLDILNMIKFDLDSAKRSLKILNLKHKQDKRSPLLNLGIISNFVGLASYDEMENLRKKLSSIENNKKNLALETRKNLLFMHKELESISKIIFENRNIGKKESFTMLKLWHLQMVVSQILSQIKSLEHALSLVKVGIPPIDLINSHEISEIVNSVKGVTETALLNVSSLPELLPFSGLIELNLHEDSYTLNIDIPLIKEESTCVLLGTDSNYKTLNCPKNRFAKVHKDDCKEIYTGEFFCDSRPCLYKNNISCTMVSKNTYVVKNTTVELCVLIKHTGSSISHSIVHFNDEYEVISLPDNNELNCESFYIGPHINSLISNTHQHLNWIKLVNLSNTVNFTVNNVEKARLLELHEKFSLKINVTSSDNWLSQIDSNTVDILSLLQTPIVLFIIICLLLLYAFRKKICKNKTSNPHLPNTSRSWEGGTDGQ